MAWSQRAGHGEINYLFLFELIDKLHYSGWTGCEYKPAKSTREGLG
jgi:hydroxypyruvate isomerase